MPDPKAPSSAASEPRDTETSAQIDINNFLRAPGDFERKAVDACVLFADLAGSTEYKMDHSAIDGLSKVILHNREVAAAIRENHGRIVKFLGDGVMAMFSGSDKEQRALEAGLAAIQRVNEANSKYDRHRNYPHSLSTKVGIHSGPVWVFRFPQSDEDDPHGLTVDIAFRLCSAAPPERIACTDETFIKGGGEVTFKASTPAHKKYLKGLAEPLETRVVAPAGLQGTPLEVLGYRARMLPHIAGKIADARRHLRTRELKQARGDLEFVLREESRNFEANICLAEIMIHEEGVPLSERTLESATIHLCRAKQSRPESPLGWLLVGYTRLKLFELTRKQSDLDSAISHTRVALDLAADCLDMHGIIRAKTLLAYLLMKKAVTCTDEGTKLNLLSEADSICGEVHGDVSWGLNRHRFEYKAVGVLVHLAQGSTNWVAMEAELAEVFKEDQDSVLAFEARMELARVRSVQPHR